MTKITEVEIIDTPDLIVTREVPTQLPALPGYRAELAAALERGDPVLIEKMMDLQDRWERNEARKAFDQALAAAKADLPVIEKNRSTSFTSKRTGGTTDYSYEDLGGIAHAVDPILAKHGLTYRWNVENITGGVRVTCILSHAMGHREVVTLESKADDSGSKNAIQALGSATTYLQRYTLKAALGLAVAGDDDGHAAAPEPEPEVISEEQANALRVMLDEADEDVAAFCRAIKVDALKDIYANKYSAAVSLIGDRRAMKAKQAREAKA